MKKILFVTIAMILSFPVCAAEDDLTFPANHEEPGSLVEYLEAQKDICNALEMQFEHSDLSEDSAIAKAGPYEPIIGVVRNTALGMETSDHKNYKVWKNYYRTDSIYVFFDRLDGHQDKSITGITDSYTGQELIAIRRLFQDGGVYAVCGKKFDLWQEWHKGKNEIPEPPKMYKNTVAIHAGTLRPIDKSIVENSK